MMESKRRERYRRAAMTVNGTGTERGRVVRSHRQLQVYRRAFEAAMQIFELSKGFPREEMYSLTSQIRRSSRSVASNIVEAWRKRRYEQAFIAKLSDADTEAAETEVHIEFAVRCGYLSREDGAELYRTYEGLLRTIVAMIRHADQWATLSK
jgi:four helix bundle protein